MIKHGTADVKRYLGTTEINKAYLGTVVVLGDGFVEGTFDATAFTAESIDTDVAESSATFMSDGTATLSGNDTSPATPKWWSNTSPDDTWISYTSTGNGTITGGLTASTRYQLNTDRTIGNRRVLANGVGVSIRTFTLSFHDAASGGTLLGTKTFTATSEIT